MNTGLGEASGPFPEIAPSESDYDRIEQITRHADPRGDFRLTPEVRDRIKEAIKLWIRDDRAYKNAPAVAELIALMRPLEKALLKVYRVLGNVTRAHPESTRADLASSQAIQLIEAYFRDLDLDALLRTVFMARLATGRAIGSLAKVSRPGVGFDWAFSRLVCELEDIFIQAGGRSVRPSTVTRERDDGGVVDGKTSGFVVFVDQCCRLASDGELQEGPLKPRYRYRHTTPAKSNGLARWIERHRAAGSALPRTFMNLLVEALTCRTGPRSV